MVGVYRALNGKMQAMLRLFRVILVGIFCAAAFTAQAQSAFDRAMDAARAQKWGDATQIIRRGSAVERDLIEWQRLRAGNGSASEVMAFLSRRSDWPGLGLLRKRSEDAFGNTRRNTVLEFFAAQDPQTAKGALIYARALEQSGNKKRANEVIVTAWKTLSVNAADHQTFMSRYGKPLKRHHVARLDEMLWRGWDENSGRMLPHVDKGWQALARARLGLRNNRNGVDGLIEAVPARLQNDPGLAYERMFWRARKDRDAGAIDLILQHSRKNNLGQPEHWSVRRRSLGRAKMRAGRYKEAYAIVSNHGLASGSAYADLEWLSGYVSLKRNRPKAALTHFERFEAAIRSPISKGRAGYWIGRAHEAAGNTQAAKAAYTRGAQHQTSFYGLLAAEKAGIRFDTTLAGKKRVNGWKNAAFTKSSVHQAALRLLKAGNLSLAERFWVHLAESQTPEELAAMEQMTVDLKEPHIGVMLGKKVAKSGVVLPAAYYALHPLASRNLPVPKEMALAIARRESEFDPVVISHADARGLMQILPSTARQVAGAIGVKYSKRKLISDPSYNVQLGTAYLDGLARQFDGNVLLVSAGYNAGPHRSVRWIDAYGDPRRRSVDVVDWVEHIPFNETRNYVMRVAESLPIYRARLGLNPHPVSFSQELKGSTLLLR